MVGRILCNIKACNLGQEQKYKHINNSDKSGACRYIQNFFFKRRFPEHHRRPVNGDRNNGNKIRKFEQDAELKRNDRSYIPGKDHAVHKAHTDF